MDRDELILSHLPQVRRIAEVMASRVPRHIDVDDLEQAGRIGLMQAAESFDAARGVKFATHAHPRIQGEMLDYLRKIDPVPRQMRQRATRVQLARDAAAGRGETLTDDEARVAAGLTAAQFAADGRTPATRSLSTKWFETDSGKDLTAGDMIPDRHAGPRACIGRADIRTMLAKFCREDRLIVLLWIESGLPWKEIAKAVGVCESQCWTRMRLIEGALRARFG